MLIKKKRILILAFGFSTLLVGLGIGLLLLNSNDNNNSEADSSKTNNLPPVSFSQGQAPTGTPPGGSSSTATYLTSVTGYSLDNGTVTESDKTYSATGEDESAILVSDGASYTLSNAMINKTGDTSSNDNSSFYGQNAAVLATSGSTLVLSDSTVTTDGSGTNGVFATGEGTTVMLSNVTIKAVGGGAHAVMATQGGSMILTDVDMLTTDSNSGAIATDRGSGTINVTGGTVETTGQDSPGIYSTGAITVTSADISASGAEAAVIEGANSITLYDTNLSSSFSDKWGVMIYQSMSGDAEGANGVFTMTGGSLAYTSATGPLFYVTNSTGVITLSGVSVTAGSGELLQAVANSRWGTTGSNGGNAILTANGQALEGNITVDNSSTAKVTLSSGSSLTGAINSTNTGKEVRLTLDSSSKWIVTADSYLTSLDNAEISGTSIANITGNGFNVYYKVSDSANSALGGATYDLVGGGYLMPY